MTAFASLEKKIADKTAKIGIIGLGYVGLPLIHAYIKGGFKTLGFDVDSEKVKKLKAGQSYIEHISSDWIKQCVGDGSLVPTDDLSR
ncbi:MAG: nucleotide sugar dehydrogenase, partial [Planctomycetaceae bacterium]|nr:nucleotide sugar dehydrogenase [Planctomycetaceae bacterium]